MEACGADMGRDVQGRVGRCSRKMPRSSRSPRSAVRRTRISSRCSVAVQVRPRLDAAQDGEHARVTVLSSGLNEKLFGGQDSTGKRIRLNEIDYTIVGGLDKWQPRVKYYDLTNGSFNGAVYTTFRSRRRSSRRRSRAATTRAGPTRSRAGMAISHRTASRIQFWVQLNSSARTDEYMAFLNNYVNEQKKLRPLPASAQQPAARRERVDRGAGRGLARCADPGRPVVRVPDRLPRQH